MMVAALLLAATAPAQAAPDGYRAPPELRLLPSARCLRFEAPGRRRPPANERDYLAQLDAAIDYCSAPRDQAVRETAAALARVRSGESPEALRAEAGRLLDEWRDHFRRELARNNSFLWKSPAADLPAKSVEDDLSDDLAEMHLSPERFGQHRRMGFLWCDWSRLSDECHTAYLAAAYSASTADLCWQRESKPYAGQHGGTMITGVPERVASKCRASIAMCRKNWRYFFDLQSSTEPAARTARAEEIVRQNLNGLCPQEAPEDAQDR